jgi:hypothetical protein
VRSTNDEAPGCTEPLVVCCWHYGDCDERGDSFAMCGVAGGSHFVCLRGCYVLMVLIFQLLPSFLLSLIVGFDVIYSISGIVLSCRTMQLRFLIHLL